MTWLLAAAALLNQGTTTPQELFADAGRETIESIRKNFYLPDTMQYAEQFEPGKTLSSPAFNWGVGVMLSALNAAARVDSKYIPWLEEYATASRMYWNDRGPVPGYDVLPAPKPVDRYYDDNAWMALALVETFETTKQAKYLEWAKQTLTFVMSGEDRASGGIFWRETDKLSKNTCSNAPAAAACLAVYRQTRDAKLVADAERVYGWTKAHLQDPADHLMWDSVSDSGHIQDTKWSYNTGLMIRSAAELFAITGKAAYKQDVIDLQSASAKRWLTDQVHDEGRFAHLLLESWIAQRRYAPVPNPNQSQSDFKALVKPLAWLHVYGRNADGFYGKRFDKSPNKDQQAFALIDQASAARAYFIAAEYFSKKG